MIKFEKKREILFLSIKFFLLGVIIMLTIFVIVISYKLSIT